jgi:methionyl-tRNA formyltransferase
LRILFFGTPAFAVPTLEALLTTAGHTVVGAVTQPDRPRGRGQRLEPTPVKVTAERAGLPVLQPDRLKDDAVIDRIRQLDADLGVVAAYGRILPQRLIDVPRLGMINVHASLLPRWRGAAPIHRAVIAGDTETGVTIMRVVLALDAGPMLARRRVGIGAEDTSADLETRLAAVGAAVLVETVNRLAQGPIVEEPQDESLVTYAARLERRESAIDWQQSAADIHNQIRGLQPWPLAAAVLQGKRVLLLRSAVAIDVPRDGAPGTVIAVEPDALVVATGDGAIRLSAIQPEGRPPMAVRAFLSGRRVVPGDRLDRLPS